MENNDMKNEELQPDVQPGEAMDATEAEVGTQAEPQAEEPTDQPQQAAAEPWWKVWWNGVTTCWSKAVAIVKGLKKPVRYAVAGGIVGLAVLIVWPWNKGDKNRFETLGQTITEMKKISEFCTANYIGEVMIKDEQRQLLGKKDIVLIVRGKVRAGYDLSRMETRVVNDSTIDLALPTAQILDIITNPSDIRTFSEKGYWSHERVTIAKNTARAKLLELVTEDNLLATAEENGRRQLTAIFGALGFKHVNITFVADTTVCNSTAIVGDSVSHGATILFAN